MNISSLRELKEIIEIQLNELLEENERDRLKMRLPEINTAICLSVQTIFLLNRQIQSYERGGTEFVSQQPSEEN